MLQCYLFGEPRITIDGQPIEPFPTQKTRSLFCYLILYHHRRHSRSVLINTFWPESDEYSARRCLSTTLWRLRRTLREDERDAPALLISGDVIGLNPQYPYWLDVANFEQSCLSLNETPGYALTPVQVELLRGAIALYQGDLMEGTYDDWVLVERERLANLYLQALIKLMDFCRRHNQLAEAIAYGQRILALDPLQESTHRELMRLYCQIGDRATAIRQYELCREWLAGELDIEPMPETRQLYQEIRVSTSTCVAISSNTWPQASPFITDDPVLDQALAYLADSRAQLNQAARQLEHAVEAVEQLLSRKLSP
jgi:DNA-binding SARP family transcriptional activator